MSLVTCNLTVRSTATTVPVRCTGVISSLHPGRDMELRFRVPRGIVGVADPGLAVGEGGHKVNLAKGRFCLLAKNKDRIDLCHHDALFVITSSLGPPVEL